MEWLNPSEKSLLKLKAISSLCPKHAVLKVFSVNVTRAYTQEQPSDVKSNEGARKELNPHVFKSEQTPLCCHSPYPQSLMLYLQSSKTILYAQALRRPIELVQIDQIPILDFLIRNP